MTSVGVKIDNSVTRCHDLAKQLSYYLYLLFFWTYYTGRSAGKCNTASYSNTTILYGSTRE